MLSDYDVIITDLEEKKEKELRSYNDLLMAQERAKKNLENISKSVFEFGSRLKLYDELIDNYNNLKNDAKDI